MASPYTTDWSSYSKLNPELEALLPALQGFKLVNPGTTIESVRKLSSGLPSELWPEVQEKDIQIPVRDGTTNVARIYSSAAEPENGNGNGKPLLVMIFGGGYVMGKVDSEEFNCRTWVKSFGGVAVSISYRLCPEHPWPVPYEDAYDALKWVAGNYQQFGADSSKAFVIGGTSAGATTALTISHLWRDEGLTPPLTGIWAAVPTACIVSALPEKYREKEKSWEQNRDAPVFNREVSDFLADLVKPDPRSPIRSPLLFENNAELPPTYLVIAGADPWRDVGLIYEEVLRESGVKTRVDVFGGLPHGFWSLFPKTGFTEEFKVKAEEGLRWLLEGK